MWCACGVSAHLCKVEAFSAVIKHQPSHQLKPCLRLDEGCDKQRCCLHAQPHVTLTIQCAQSTPATFRDFRSCGLDAPFTCCTNIPCNWLFDRELKSASDLSLPWPIDPLTGCVNGQPRGCSSSAFGIGHQLILLLLVREDATVCQQATTPLEEPLSPPTIGSAHSGTAPAAAWAHRPPAAASSPASAAQTGRPGQPPPRARC